MVRLLLYFLLWAGLVGLLIGVIIQWARYERWLNKHRAEKVVILKEGEKK